ncbi:MAG: thiol-disulfide isomerase/thioredoxin, partial [Lentimonas sp.]
MLVTKKDKKLILFILSLIIFFWFAFLITSSLFSKVSLHNSELKNLVSHDAKWLNSSRDIKINDLKNRIILLDFWNYSCVNCFDNISEVKKLKKEFSDNLTVIGVHSAKFNNQKDSNNIKKAILKYDISNLVINDSNLKIWEDFKISSWPTLVLLNPQGEVVKKYENKISIKEVRKDVLKLAEKYRYEINKNSLPIVLERNKAISHILKFPSEIEFAQDFSYLDMKKTNALIISNTGKNKIIFTNLDGKILLEIGSNEEGFQDGFIDNAKFNSPRGLLFKDNILYVADMGNHALRKINFKSGEVETLIGTGKRGGILTTENIAEDFSLSSPWGLEFFPDKNNIIISNAGTNQLLKFDIKKRTITPFAGNGTEGMKDGKYPSNTLAQPRFLSGTPRNLYFIDSKSSSLRQIDKKGHVKTFIGKGLFEFGNKNGSKKEALMQHPNGLAVTNKSVYITDTHNHLIRRYDFQSEKISNFSGNIQGSGVGNKNDTTYSDPEAIIFVGDKFYITDTNNNRIIELDSKTGNSKLIDIIPKLVMPAEGLLEYLPNLNKISTKKISSSKEVSLFFNLKKGWKINDSAPSFFNLVEIGNEKEANLITSFDESEIR